MPFPPDTPIDELKNLGSVSQPWLATAGIYTLDDLERIGSVEAFLRVRDTVEGVKPSLVLLYALEAALRDIHWTRLPPEVKRVLRVAIR